jgi:ribosome recycling factor
MIGKDDLDRGEDDVQKLTDRYIDDINSHGDHKEKEVMEV